MQGRRFGLSSSSSVVVIVVVVVGGVVVVAVVAVVVVVVVVVVRRRTNRPEKDCNEKLGQWPNYRSAPRKVMLTANVYRYCLSPEPLYSVGHITLGVCAVLACTVPRRV